MSTYTEKQIEDGLNELEAEALLNPTHKIELGDVLDYAWDWETEFAKVLVAEWNDRIPPSDALWRGLLGF